MKLTSSTRPDADKPIKLTPVDELGPVTAWSYSALKVFEECAYRTYISRVKRIPEPSSPAADRGSMIHDEAENYVNGTLDEFPASLKKFTTEFKELREQYNGNWHLKPDVLVELEGEWAFTSDWQPTAWLAGDCWVRIKLDAYVKEDQTSARVIDYKTGKKFGNEVGHGQQCLLYAIAAFMRDPELQFVKTELWYLDQGETTTQSFTRDEAMMFFPGFHSRGVKMTTTKDFDPTPSKAACRWCSYRKGDFPECQWGVGPE